MWNLSPRGEEIHLKMHTLPPTHTISPIYIFKLLKTKDKEKIIKASRGKRHTTYKGTKVRIKADFSSEKLYDQKKIE